MALSLMNEEYVRVELGMKKNKDEEQRDCQGQGGVGTDRGDKR